MIASLSGTVEHVALDRAVIAVGGLGVQFSATPQTLSTLHEGRPGAVQTHLVVKEDALTLYGFADRDEREVFEVLITANGVGPRLALAILSVHHPETVRRAVTEEDEKKLQEQIQGSKGVGNFRSLFVNIPGGTEKAIQIIPIGDVATKDEFERIKNITRADVIAAHRMNPALAGIMPENSSGFGDIEKIDRVFTNNEIRPIAMLFLQINATLRADRRVAWNEPAAG